MVDAALKTFGKLDILVNNAGATCSGCDRTKMDAVGLNLVQTDGFRCNQAKGKQRRSLRLVLM